MIALTLVTLALAVETAAPAAGAADPSFQQDAKVQKLAEAYAADAVDIAQKQFQLPLDFTDPSVQSVEAMLKILHDTRSTAKPPAEQVANFAKVFGSYLGEVLRRNHGGTWGVTKVDGQSTPGLKTRASGSVIRPWGLAHARIVTGPSADVWEYYRALLGREGAVVPPTREAPAPKPRASASP